MPWPLIPLSPERYRELAVEGMLSIGHCTLAPWVLKEEHWRSKDLGKHYWDLPEPRRAPILIMLPGDNEWCPDQMAWTSDRQSHGNGWQVTGTWPLITTAPSINFVGRYHGYVVDGQITDDCEGRTFKPQAPPPLS